MNFCRVYNKTMNWIESVSIKVGAGTIGEYPRRNRSEINIFQGILYLILTVFCGLFIMSFGGVWTLLLKLYKVTTSKCNLEEK